VKFVLFQQAHMELLTRDELCVIVLISAKLCVGVPMMT